MKNTIKKGLLVGIGAVEAMKPKVRKVLGEFEKAGLLRRKQVNSLLASVISAAKKQQKNFKEKARGRAGKIGSKAKSMAKKLESRGRKTAKKWVARAQKELR